MSGFLCCNDFILLARIFHFAVCFVKELNLLLNICLIHTLIKMLGIFLGADAVSEHFLTDVSEQHNMRGRTKSRYKLYVHHIVENGFIYSAVHQSSMNH